MLFTTHAATDNATGPTTPSSGGSGGGFSIDQPVTAGPTNPTQLTWRVVQKSVYDPGRAIAPGELLTDLHTEAAFSGMQVDTIGSASHSLRGDLRQEVIGSGGGFVYLNTGTYLRGTSAQQSLYFASYTIAPTGETRAVLALRRPGEEVWVGVNLKTNQPLAYLRNPAQGTEAAISFLSPAFPTTTAQVVEMHAIYNQEFVNLLVVFADGQVGEALLLSPTSISSAAKDLTNQFAPLVYADSGATFLIKAIQVGRPQYGGLVNQRLRTTTKGAPVERDGEYFIASSANLLDIASPPSDYRAYANSPLSLFALDKSTGVPRKASGSEVDRDGGYFTDGVGQYLSDEDSNEEVRVGNKWGNNQASPYSWNTQIHISRTTADVTKGHIRWSNGYTCNFDNANFIHYDPSYVEVGNTKFVTCTRKAAGGDSSQGAYWPVTYKSTVARPGPNDWTLAWEDKSQVAGGNNYEGNCLFFLAGVWWVLVVGRGSLGVRVYNLLTGQYMGVMVLPFAFQGNPAHPCIYPWRRAGTTVYRLHGMDASYIACTSFLLESIQVTSGYDFPERSFAR